MADNKKTPGPAATPNGQPPTMQEYRKEQVRLRDMIEKQKQLSQRLALLEETINQKETTYLESTAHGNIITGFDGYIKGNSGAAANKKKPPPLEQNRVFTRSSISYRPNTSGDATPGSSTPAQTPVSGTASGNATPTSATVARAGKKKKVEDESEPDTIPSNSKKRIAFGMVRK